MCVIFGQKRGKLNARRNIYSENKSYIEFFSQFARVYANFLVQYLFCQRKAFLLQEKCIRCLVVSKTKHWKTKTEARSTKHPKHPKHPNLEDEVPKTRKRSTQNSKPVCPWKSRDSPLSSDQCWYSRITNRLLFKTIQVELRGVGNAFPPPWLN